MASKVKLPMDLMLNDPFFIVESSPMDDHKGIFSKSPINHFSLAQEKVKRIEFSERDEDTVIITGKTGATYPAPAKGKSKPNVGDVISDESLAYEIAMDLANVELKKAEQLLEEAEKVVSGVKGNIKALETRSPYGSKGSKSVSGRSTLFAVKVEEESNQDKNEEVDD